MEPRLDRPRYLAVSGFDILYDVEDAVGVLKLPGIVGREMHSSTSTWEDSSICCVRVRHPLKVVFVRVYSCTYNVNGPAEIAITSRHSRLTSHVSDLEF